MPAIPHGSGLLGISCVSRNYCVAVGYSGDGTNPPTAPLAEVFEGSSWRAMATPDPTSYPLAAPNLTGVSCWAQNRCVAVGTMGLRSHGTRSFSERLNATGWHLTPVPEPPGTAKGSRELTQLGSVSCPAPSRCLGVGSLNIGRTGSGSLFEAFSGAGWRVGSGPNPSAGSDLNGGISCVSANACTAVGFDDVTGQPLIEHWDGNRWRVERTPGLPVGVRLNDVGCAQPHDCLANGTTDEQQGFSAAETP